jgi:hypothetical protein
MQASSGNVEIKLFLRLGSSEALVELFCVEFAGIGLSGLSRA